MTHGSGSNNQVITPKVKVRLKGQMLESPHFMFAI